MVTQGNFPVLAHHPTSTTSSFGGQELERETPPLAEASSDELVEITKQLFNNEHQEDLDSTDSTGLAEFFEEFQSTLPSTPPQQESTMNCHHYQLPSIRSFNVHQSQYLAPYGLVKPESVYHPCRPSLPPAPTSVSLPSISLPSLTRSSSFSPSLCNSLPPRIPSPASPCSSPESPKRNKKNYTKEFNVRFHDLLDKNQDAANEWHRYSQRHKTKCTIKRAPCIKVSRGFCASYGREFTEFAKEEKYGALGTRTECLCQHRPVPLRSSSSSSGSGPAAMRNKRPSVRNAPYPEPTSTPSTPDVELPIHSAHLDKHAWLMFLEQSASTMQQGFNTFLGGAQCTVCGARRPFANSDEVIMYMMRERIPCTQACCNGSLQIRQ
jgi:hypothetical protein